MSNLHVPTGFDISSSNFEFDHCFGGDVLKLSLVGRRYGNSCIFPVVTGERGCQCRQGGHCSQRLAL